MRRQVSRAQALGLLTSSLPESPAGSLLNLAEREAAASETHEEVVLLTESWPFTTLTVRYLDMAFEYSYDTGTY